MSFCTEALLDHSIAKGTQEEYGSPAEHRSVWGGELSGLPGGRVPDRRELHRERASITYAGVPLSFWLNSKLCIHRMRCHRPGKD